MSKLQGALIALLVTLCGGCAADNANAPVATDDPEVKTAVEGMWNYAPEMAEACPHVLEYRVALGPDGAVNDTQLVSPNPLPMPCAAADESARRAIMKASPLHGTKGVSTIVVRFDYKSPL